MSKSHEQTKRMMEEAERKNQAIYASVAEEVISRLDEDDKRYIRLHPQSHVHHFGLALGIRNEYIYSGKIELCGDPDHMSGEIMDIIIRRLLPEYDDVPRLLKWVDSDEALGSIHYLYFSNDKPGDFLEVARGSEPSIDAAEEELKAHPIEFGDDYEILNHEELDEAWESHYRTKKAIVLDIAEGLWNFGELESRARAFGLTPAEVRDFESFCRASVNGDYETQLFVPASVGLLGGYDLLDDCQRETSLRDFDVLLEQYPRSDWLAHVPAFLFKSRNVARHALKKDGYLLQVMPQWSKDKELVCAAVGSEYNAIKFVDSSLAEDKDVIRCAMGGSRYGSVLFEETFRKYNDDDELVRLAVQARPSNLAYASERLRDDFDMAMLAIENSDDDFVQNFYKELSDRLKNDREIVLAIAKSRTLPYEFPPAAYRDDDEVGRLLADETRHDHFALIRMSRRIKEMYMTEDELSRWGDDPEDEEW